MTFNQYLNQVRKGWKTILSCALLFFILGTTYGIFFFDPTYVSKAKVLIQDIEPTTFVADIGNRKKLGTNSNDKNPILTQVEILNSYDMAKRVYNSLQKQGVFSVLNNNDAEVLIGKLRQSLELKNPPATDIINISVEWNAPEKAYKIAQAYLDEYYRFDVERSNQSITQSKQYIQKQLTSSENELRKVRDFISEYRKNNRSVDLPTEVSSITAQIADMEKSVATLESQMGYHNRKVIELSQKLGINPQSIKKVVEAVAVGQNDNINNLWGKLSTAEQEYAQLLERYPATTKRMTALREGINEIKEQIKVHTTLTVGKTHDDLMVIKDPVRTELVRNLIDSQTELNALDAQKNSMQSTLKQVRGHQSAIPDQQLALSELLEKESNLISIVGTLNSKLIEAQVRESGTISNVSVVQAPTHPMSTAFPSTYQLIFMLTFIGGLIGVLLVLSRHYLEDRVESLSELEFQLKTSIFGSLSWIPEHNYQNTISTELNSPVNALEYQRIVTYLKIQAEDKCQNTIGFTSVHNSKSRSTIIANIANLLSNCNYNVLLIDADFRNGNVAQEFGLKRQSLPDMLELLKFNEALFQPELEKKLSLASGSSQATKETIDFIANYISKVADNKSLYLLTGHKHTSDAYEVVTNKNLPLLINRVKEQFDFVLVDTPPLLEISDSIVTARYLDGLVVLCNTKTRRSELKNIRKLCNDNQVELIGAIAKLTS